MRSTKNKETGKYLLELFSEACLFVADSLGAEVSAEEYEGFLDMGYRRMVRRLHKNGKSVECEVAPAKAKGAIHNILSDTGTLRYDARMDETGRNFSRIYKNGFDPEAVGREIERHSAYILARVFSLSYEE